MSGIDSLFAGLAAAYGVAWERSLGDAPIDEVKAAWVSNLKGLDAKQLRYGAEHLPPKPPNVFEFRAICKSAPMPPTPQLPRPVPTQEKLNSFGDWKARMVDALRENAKQDPKEWARRLQERHQKGEKLTPWQIQCYQEALGMKGKQPWQ